MGELRKFYVKAGGEMTQFPAKALNTTAYILHSEHAAEVQRLQAQGSGELEKALENIRSKCSNYEYEEGGGGYEAQLGDAKYVMQQVERDCTEALTWHRARAAEKGE